MLSSSHASREALTPDGAPERMTGNPDALTLTARQLHAAFADPGIRAVLATIGGDDQITVVPHLDPAVLTADPKPFLGYSDNTLLTWMHTRLFIGFVLRLPLLVWRRLFGSERT